MNIMKIGIISDTHGRDKMVELALDIFRQNSVQTIVHCGDISSTCTIEILGTSGMTAYAVAGNVDHDIADLQAAAGAFGVIFSPHSLVVTVGDGKLLAVTHGNNPVLLQTLISSDLYAYVCHGHTHKAADYRQGQVRVINPGSLFNCRHPHYPTVAVLDTKTDQLELIKVESKS